MKMSSKKTMLTAAVLVTLSSGTAFAATPGTVDSQELFHSNRLVTDPTKNPAVEENTVGDRYEASISSQKKSASDVPVMKASPSKTTQPARLRWQSVDARLATRNNDPSFSLSAQKAKPVIITAEDIRREEKLAAKEGRPVNELVGDVNMNRPVPPPRPKRSVSSAEMQNPVDEAMEGTALHPDTHRPSTNTEQQLSQNPAASGGMYASTALTEGQYAVSVQGHSNAANMQVIPPAQRSTETAASVAQNPMQQNAENGMLPHASSSSDIRQVGGTAEKASVAASAALAASAGTQQPPSRPHYSQLPHEGFSLTPPAENGAVQKRPEQFATLGSVSVERPAVPPVRDITPAVEHSVRPDGVPAMAARQAIQNTEEDLAGISDEVRRHILAGQLAMEVQLNRDPSVAGMRAITKVLRENTTLTHLQKIDFLIGFGRGLHRSGLPRQQEALLIKTIAEAF